MHDCFYVMIIEILLFSTKAMTQRTWEQITREYNFVFRKIVHDCFFM